MEKTLDYYNNNSEFYFNRTIKIPLDMAYPYLLDRIPQGCHILDLGAGSGRDSKYFADQGFKVTSIDGSKGLAAVAKSKLGIDIKVQKYQDLNYEREFDAVWASSSLLHSTDDELRQYIPKISKALKFGGFFYASFKYGESSKTDPLGRFFNFQNFQSLTALFEPTDFEIQIIELIDSYVEGAYTKWIHMVLKKKVASIDNVKSPTGKYYSHYQHLKEIATKNDLNLTEVEQFRLSKASKFGSFSEGIYLNEIDGKPKNAIIRDYYPEVFDSQNRYFSSRVMNKYEIIKELENQKIQEELSELQKAQTRENILKEFADVLEVLENLEYYSTTQ